MVQINSATNVKDFNTYVSTKAVGEFGGEKTATKKIPTENPNAGQNSFAQAIYSEGYSLMRPNMKSEIFVQNIDILA